MATHRGSWSKPRVDTVHSLNAWNMHPFNRDVKEDHQAKKRGSGSHHNPHGHGAILAISHLHIHTASQAPHKKVKTLTWIIFRPLHLFRKNERLALLQGCCSRQWAEREELCVRVRSLAGALTETQHPLPF